MRTNGSFWSRIERQEAETSETNDERMSCSGHPPITNNRDALHVLWLKIQTNAAGIIFSL